MMSYSSGGIKKSMTAVFQRLEEANVTLNGTKCEFNKSSVKFLGLIKAESSPTLPIQHQMSPPQSDTQVRRFMGLVNQLGSNSRLKSMSNHAWIWGPEQGRIQDLM